MPNILDGNGLQVRTREELVAIYTANYKSIYGDDINLDSDTPDGQKMNIEIQAVLDIQDLLVQIYNSFDPDLAIGKILDQRVAINGVVRQAGTYTVTNISIVTTKSLNLYGLDIEPDADNPLTAYTIADNANNRWYLVETVIALAPGTHTLAFRAAVPGAQLTIPGTITTQISIVSGVASVNNPTNPLAIGTNEESDAVLKVRRSRSVSGGSQGYYASLKTELDNTDGVSSSFIYENDSDATDSDGTPSHSIWVVVAGSALPVDIATAIYRKRNAGAGMRGNQSYDVMQLDGTVKNIRWDNVILQNLYIQFDAYSIDGITPPNIGLIRQMLPSIYVPGVNETLDINGLATAVQSIDPNTVISNEKLSDARIQYIEFYTALTNGSYQIGWGGLLSNVIQWNDSDATAQTKIRVIPGLSGALYETQGTRKKITIVDGSDPLYNIDFILTVENNTLNFSNTTPYITFEGSDVLAPASKRKQFLLTSSNIVILPLRLEPTNITLLKLGTATFQGQGGYGTYTYSIGVGAVGTMNPTTGFYTAPNYTGFGTVKVKDALGNQASSNTTVI